mgnify:CR=1 FL=1
MSHHETPRLKVEPVQVKDQWYVAVRRGYTATFIPAESKTAAESLSGDLGKRILSEMASAYEKGREDGATAAIMNERTSSDVIPPPWPASDRASDHA